jgi:chorismate mutase
MVDPVTSDKTERYYLVRSDILPDALLKTLEAKRLLASGEIKTVNEAVEHVGLSRSAFYKYKDGIHDLTRLERDRIVIISLDLQHRAGVLSKVLAIIAGHEGNVLAINQTIPLQGIANVVITLETSAMQDHLLGELMEVLRRTEGVTRTGIIGRG